MTISSVSISASLTEPRAIAPGLPAASARGLSVAGAARAVIDQISISQEGSSAAIALTLLQAVTSEQGGRLALANGTRADMSGGAFRVSATLIDTEGGPQRSVITIAGSEAAETVDVTLRPGRPSPAGAEASSGVALVYAGGGDDTIAVAATGTAGQEGVDTGYWLSANVDGGSGDDRISFAGGVAASFLVAGGEGNDTLIGTGAWLVNGGEGDDVIEARQTDIVRGGSGNDRITVGHGTNVIMQADNGTDVVQFDAAALNGQGFTGLNIIVQEMLPSAADLEASIAVRRDGADFVVTGRDGGSIRIKDAAEATWSVGIDTGIIDGQRRGARIVAADTPSGARLSFSV